MTLPVVYAAAPGDVRDALDAIRSRVSDLAEPRLYQVAVALQVLSRTGRATTWASWSSPPPPHAIEFGRAHLISAMRDLFETDANALLRQGSAVITALGSPSRVMVDPFYGANGPLTVVRRGLIGGGSRRDSAKITLDDDSWLWSAPAPGAARVVRTAEYNPVNSLNQQNGIGCALPAADAVARTPADPRGVYAVGRTGCPKRMLVAGSEPKCRINDKVCGGQGDGEARATTKPRLLAPPVAGEAAYLVLPETIPALVAQATRGGRRLPRGADLSLLVAWCHANGNGAALDSSSLPRLLGADGLQLLTSKS